MKPQRIIHFVSRIVPRRFRSEWKQEWEAELFYHQSRTAKRDTLRRSLGAFRDALAMQPRRLEDEMFQDLRYGCRMLAKSRGVTLVALLTLAIGIGSVAAMFSVIDTVALRPLPYANPDRLAFLWTHDLKGGVHEEQTSYLTIQDWRHQSRSFADIAMFSTNGAFLTDTRSPEPVSSAFASSNLFAVLGVSPRLGRTFTGDEEERHERLAVLSYGLWQRRFGSATDVVGKTITIDGQVSTVIGVMPRGFYFPTRDVEFWEPTTLMWRADYFRSLRFHDTWGAVGRLNSGITLEVAQKDMNGIAQQMTDTISVPPSETGFQGFGVDVVPLFDQLTGRNTGFALWILFAAVGFVLLIACANVSNLLLARTASRGHELAIRTALGAGRLRLIRQMLVESVILASAGGIIGLTLAAGEVRLIAIYGSADIPRLDEVTIAPSVLAFTVGVTFLCGLFFGSVSAVKTSNAQFVKGASSRTSRVLIIGQCAIAVVLLAGTGLMIRSFLNLRTAPAGFESENAILVRLAFPQVRVTPPPSTGSNARPEPKPQPLARISASVFFPRLFESVGAVPGVRSVGAIDDFFMRRNPEDKIAVEGRAEFAGPSPQLLASQVTPEFFTAAGVPLKAGRLFTTNDVGSTAAVIVNETFARTFFPTENPIGREFRSSRGLHKIAGVVADMRRQGLETEPIAEMFFADSRGAELVIRTSTDPIKLMPAIREAIHAVEKNVPITRMETIRQHVDGLNSARRFETWLLSIFGGVALALCATALYGMTHYAVTRRTSEIGIRMAVGASKREVVAMILRQGMMPPLAGCVIGLGSALLLTRVISHLLFGVSATDPLTFGAITLVLIAVSLVACYIPARKASRVDPLVALRHD